jgi:hypothetical protein
MSYFRNIEEYNFQNLKFSTTKQTAGRRFLNVYYDKKPLGIKLPSLRIPFDSKINHYGQLELNVSLGNNNDLISKVKELDSDMVNFAEVNEWIDHDCEYVPTLKVSKGNSYPPTLKAKIPFRGGSVETSFFDKEKNHLTNIESLNDASKLLNKGKYILSALECTGVWFNEQRWGLSWKAVQIRLVADSTKMYDDNSRLLDGCCFEEDSSDCGSNISENCLILDE